MTTEAEARQIRGAKIAKAQAFERRGNGLWLVNSQSHGGKWLVDYSGGQPTCTCPDYEGRSAFCKHIFAIEIHEQRLTMPNADDGQPSKKKTYRQDWPNYNAAQVNEGEHFGQLLHGLCQGIVMAEQTGPGRPRAPLSDVVFSLVMKVYTGMSGRRASSTLRGYAERGLTDTTISYNSLSDYMSDETLTPLLRKLVQESAAPLAAVESQIAIDSTGFGTQNYDRWYDEKWGKNKSKRRFVKAHAAIGTKTHVCTDLIVDSGGDAPQLVPLLEGTMVRFTVEEVSADKAYLSKANVAAIDAAGAVPYIPFKEGTSGKKGPRAWKKMYHYFLFKQDDFMAHYHRRSNVETAFAMVKQKFGSSVRAKSDAGMANEVYCKMLCHNIAVLVSAIYELNLKPEFWDGGATVALDNREVA